MMRREKTNLCDIPLEILEIDTDRAFHYMVLCGSSLRYRSSTTQTAETLHSRNQSLFETDQYPCSSYFYFRSFLFIIFKSLLQCLRQLRILPLPRNPLHIAFTGPSPRNKGRKKEKKKKKKKEKEKKRT